MDLDKILNLSKITGDRVIIYNSVDNSAFAVMGVKEYEDLLLAKADVRGLSEDDLLEKINRDVALWRANQEENLSNLSDFGVQDKLPISTDLDAKKSEKIEALDKSNEFGKIYTSPNDEKLGKNTEGHIDDEKRYYYLEPLE